MHAFMYEITGLGETGCQALKLDRSDYDLVSSIKKVLRPLKR